MSIAVFSKLTPVLVQMSCLIFSTVGTFSKKLALFLQHHQCIFLKSHFYHHLVSKSRKKYCDLPCVLKSYQACLAGTKMVVLKLVKQIISCISLPKKVWKSLLPLLTKIEMGWNPFWSRMLNLNLSLGHLNSVCTWLWYLIKSGSLVFCCQNFLYLLWEKIVLVIEKWFWNLRLKV